MTIRRTATLCLAILFTLSACHKKSVGPPSTPATQADGSLPVPRAPVADAPSPETDAVMAAHGEQINDCFQTKAQMGIPNTGDVTLRWQVASKGDVLDVQLVESTAHNEHLEACLLKAVKTWKYPSRDTEATLNLVHTFPAP